MTDILDVAREQVLERGEGLSEEQILEVLRLPDERVDDALALAHEVRMRWCGPEVEVEGIVSAEDGRLPGGLPLLLAVGPLRDAGARGAASTSRRWSRRRAQTARPGRPSSASSPPCAAPTSGSWRRCASGVEAIRDAVDINVACSLGILTRAQADELAEIGVHRYNHNLEAARSHFPQVVTTHTWEERWETLRARARAAAWRSAAAASSAWARRSSSAPSSRRSSPTLEPDEVPLNFLDPRPGTPFADLPAVERSRRAARRSPRSGWRCRGRSCASPAGAS